MRSIQSKFLTVVISGMLILAIAISAVSVVYISGILEEDSNVITESVTSTEALRINDALKEVEYSAQLMETYVSSSVERAQFLSDDYLEDYCVKAKKIFHAIADGCDCALSYFLRFSPELTNNRAGFYVARASTGASFSDVPTSSLENYETDPALFWFSEPKNKGEAMWSEPYVDISTEVKMISYVVPIYINYQFVGVLGVDIAFSRITEMVDNISVYDNGFAYLAGSDGRIVYSSADSHVINRAATEHGYAEERNSLISGLTLVVHADYSDIQRDSYRILWMIVVIVFVLTACFVLITFILTRKMIRPLKNLTSAAELFADGNFDVQIDSCERRDEVGTLARAFNKTAIKMKGYTNYINALAYKDGLTGVKNRAAYNDFSNSIDIKIKSGKCEPFAVLVADINRLKAANDKYGHEVGNKLIVKSAKVICDTFKRSPVFRIGGDEFAAILREDDFEKYAELLEKMDAVSASSSVVVDDDEIAVSMARAVAVYDERLDTSFEDVFNRADRKMYSNKRSMREFDGS